MTYTTLILCVLAAIGPLLLAVPVLLFTLEVCLAIVCRRQRSRPLVQAPPRTAILIPAHNEAAGITTMLQSLRTTLRGTERVIVIADNCTDNTAELAQQAGAEVFERTHATERGKGYALAFGIERLKARSPEVLVILDADCEVSPDAVSRLAYEANRTMRPVQGLYLCHAPTLADPRTALSAMAFQFKNHIRPLGMSLLRGPSYLTGSGMAIPWELVQKVPWASGNVVEDMQLGLDYAQAGFAPIYFEGAQILSPLPTNEQAANTQRTRWEHGHLKTLFRQCPKLAWQGLRQGRPSLLLLACDLAIPPLALLVSMWILSLLVSVILCACAGNWWPAALSAVEGGLLAGSVLGGWFVFCRETVPFKTPLRIPEYIFGKLRIYAKFVQGAEQRWVRTQRAGE